MPATIPAAPLQLSPRQIARLVWLGLRTRYLRRRMERASVRVNRLGVERASGRLLHFARRWLACHEEIGAILQEPLPPEAVQVRKAIIDRRRGAPAVLEASSS
ncbi:hypothetical protein LRS73_35620 (plasmid) [Methylobacterium currus]|uniref:hypothetical protein n=1 Tax=Methylobacterium currus TaxID=2051553 RepID=UPI001E323094|nr:hypothetical protein [Methylobacterium currus]UHC20463.1 hypothetical protein LRS73_35620 [Methylobacterium currus]